MPRDRSLPVLVVDDSAVMRKVICLSLDELDIRRVDTAVSGEEAFQKLRTRRYSLVICDYIMPGMSGLQLFGAMYADPTMRDTPFLLMTTQDAGAGTTLREYERLKAIAIKPFTTEALKRRIEEACR